MTHRTHVGRTPEHSGIEVLARGADMVVAAHHTKVHFYEARTVEAVRFDSPSRIEFTHLAGPVPHAFEEFTLDEVDGNTALGYRGEVGIDFSFLGRLAARFWVRPQWERAVSEHLEDVRQRAEQRARLESGHRRAPPAGQASA